MTLTYVDSVPKKGVRPRKHWRKNNKLMYMIEDFVNDHRKIARICVDGDEGYRSVMTFRRTLCNAIEKCGRENEVRIVQRGDELYLVKD